MLIRRALLSPFDVYVNMAALALTYFFVANPSFPVHAAAVMLNIATNECLQACLCEIQGVITTSGYYSIIGPMGKFLDKVLCIVLFLLLPVLMDVTSRLPFYATGYGCAAFTVFFAARVEEQRRDNSDLLVRAAEEGSGFDRVAAMGMLFATQETVSRIASFVHKGRAEGVKGCSGQGDGGGMGGARRSRGRASASCVGG